jgi:hypothetical protein
VYYFRPVTLPPPHRIVTMLRTLSTPVPCSSKALFPSYDKCHVYLVGPIAKWGRSYPPHSRCCANANDSRGEINSSRFYRSNFPTTVPLTRQIALFLNCENHPVGKSSVPAIKRISELISAVSFEGSSPPWPPWPASQSEFRMEIHRRPLLDSLLNSEDSLQVHSPHRSPILRNSRTRRDHPMAGYTQPDFIASY